MLSRHRRAFLVGDLPFGSYEASTEQAVHSGTRLLKEGGMHALKLEGASSRIALDAASSPALVSTSHAADWKFVNAHTALDLVLHM